MKLAITVLLTILSFNLLTGCQSAKDQANDEGVGSYPFAGQQQNANETASKMISPLTN